MSSIDSITLPGGQNGLFRSSVSATERSNLKILSLDGGGIRGLSSLMILEEIFSRLNLRRAQLDAALSPIEPCDYFDLIGGTSTGGIIALMLGRLRMSISQCKDEYLKLGAKVFVPQKGIGRGNKFDATRFESVLKNVISRQLTSPEGVPGRENAPLIDPRGASCCKTVVYALPFTNTNPSEATSLRTYHATSDAARPFTIWQAARATSAAPTFFEPLVVPADGGSEWVDGGLTVNNPADRIFKEVRQLWGEENQRFDVDRIGLFLSLGTGVGGTVSLKGGFWNDITTRMGVPETLIKSIVKSTFDTESPNQRLLATFNEMPETSKKYYRFNADSGLRDIDFFAYKRVHEIREHTFNYLKDQRTLQHLNHCILQAIEVLHDPVLAELPSSLSEHTMTTLVDLLKGDRDLLRPVEYYDAGRYFNHLTPNGMEIYGAMHECLPRDAEGCVKFEDFAAEMCRFGPDAEKLRDIWARMRGDMSVRLPRNVMLCILYMVHVECFDSRFSSHKPARSEDGNWAMTNARFRIAQSFGNWVQCRFHHGRKWCGRSWSFANNQWGMCRGLETDVECDLWLYYQGKIGEKKDGFHKVLVDPRRYDEAKSYREECRKQFLSYSELPRP